MNILKNSCRPTWLNLFARPGRPTWLNPFMGLSIALALALTANAESVIDSAGWSSTTWDKRYIVDNGDGTSTTNSSIQGAAYYGGKVYQFWDKGATYRVYDIASGAWGDFGSALTCASSNHFGSATFAASVADGCTIPYVYVSGHYRLSDAELEAAGGSSLYTTVVPSKYEIMDVVDIEHNTLVKRYIFNNRYDDAIFAYDWTNSRFWMVGYETASGYAQAPYYIQEYKFDSTDARGYTEVGDMVAVPAATADGTLQDCVYSDGHIYILVGWGTGGKTVTINGEERTIVSRYVGVHDYDVTSKTVIASNFSTDTSEAEGLAYDSVNNNFYITSSSSKFWKLCVHDFTSGTTCSKCGASSIVHNHSYQNGFCRNTAGDCDAPYESYTISNSVYQIVSGFMIG